MVNFAAHDHWKERAEKAEAENVVLKDEVERLRQALLVYHHDDCGVFGDGICDCSYIDC